MPFCDLLGLALFLNNLIYESAVSKLTVTYTDAAEHPLEYFFAFQ